MVQPSWALLTLVTPGEAVTATSSPSPSCHAWPRHLPTAMERRQRRLGGPRGHPVRRAPGMAGGAGSLVDHDRHGPRVSLVLATAVAAPSRVPLHPGCDGRAGGRDGRDGHARRHPGGGAEVRHQIPALLQARCSGI